MKGLFIINPSSGRQNFIDKIKEIAGMLVIDQICNTIDVFYTEKQDDALNKAAALEKASMTLSLLLEASEQLMR